MGSAVDATGKPRNHDQIMLAKIVGKAPSEAARRSRGVAGADNRHGLPVEQLQVAPRNEQRGRILQLGKQARIKAPTHRKKTGAELLDAGDLLLSVANGPDCGRFPAATTRQVRNGGERGRWRPETQDQLAEGDRPDARSAQQPQAVD